MPDLSHSTPDDEDIHAPDSPDPALDHEDICAPDSPNPALDHEDIHAPDSPDPALDHEDIHAPDSPNPALDHETSAGQNWPELARHPAIPERSPPIQDWPEGSPEVQTTSWASWLLTSLTYAGDLDQLEAGHHTQPTFLVTLESQLEPGH
ncbi:hypothetical protein BKA83DRAFT_13428 [Pisolithus microcarpus]|nr:hypothetical protein BKA83DRAFT_13428 [Pisolithus microcarpus]